MQLDYSALVGELDPDRTIVFDSPEANQETMRRWGVSQEIRQLGRGVFRCAISIRSTDQADFYSDRYNRAFVMRLEAPEDKVGLLLLRSPSGRVLVSGENAADDSVVVIPPGSGADIVSTGIVACDAVTIPEARFVEALRALCPTLESPLPDRAAVLQGDEQLSLLRRGVLGLTGYPVSEVHEEQVAKVLETAISCVGHGQTRLRPERLRLRSTRTAVTKQAQAYIEEHYAEPFRAEALCEETGIGLRTLQRCFKEYFNLSISSYLESVRLDAVRRALATADPADETVARIALQHGFTHLGRFSVRFRERFGESPRELLAR